MIISDLCIWVQLLYWLKLLANCNVHFSRRLLTFYLSKKKKTKVAYFFSRLVTKIVSALVFTFCCEVLVEIHFNKDFLFCSREFVVCQV